MSSPGNRGLKRSSSNPDVHTDTEVEQIARGLDRTASMRTGKASPFFSILYIFCDVFCANIRRRTRRSDE